MVAYFKKQNILFLVLGALLGCAVATLCFSQLTAGIPGYFKVFFLLIPMFIGAIVGRFAAGIWANKRLKQIYGLLYTDIKPQEFLDTFGPLMAKVPDITIEYVDGKNKLAYAHEALGQFAQAEACIADVDTDKLKLHQLGGMAMTSNQQIRLQLLQEQTEQARESIEQLRIIGEAAVQRAPALGKNTLECVRLYENWLAALEGQPADEEYLLEEVELSKNRIHKSEMLLVLAQVYRNGGDEHRWQETLLEAMSEGRGLYAEGRARELLSAR
jgi:hypothetical protein